MSGQRVQDHYARPGSGTAIAARVIAALRAFAGADVAITPETLAPIDHLHGRGYLATQEPDGAAGTATRRGDPRHRQRPRRSGALDRGDVRLRRDRRGPDRGIL